MTGNLAEAWLGAFRNKDFSSLELAEDFVHVSPFGEIRGGDAYRDMVEQNAEAFYGKPIEVLDVFDCGDRAAVRYLVDGFPACDCIYARDGRIARVHAYYHFGEKPVLPALSRWYGGLQGR